MKKEKNTLKVAAIASSAALIGVFGTTDANAALLDFESLGTGAELRSNLITADAANPIVSNTNVELECGEGKCGEGKCGEGKCGEKGDKKKADSKDAKSSKSGTMTAAPADDAKAKEAKPDSKAKEADPKK